MEPNNSKLFVIGTSEYQASGSAIVAYDALTGTPVWRRKYTRKEYVWGAYASAGVVSPDSRTLFVTGTVHTSLSDMYSGTVAYSSATGKTLWKTRVNNASTLDIVVSADRAAMFVSGGTPDNHFFLAKYDAATGALVWQAEDTPGYAGPEGLSASHSALIASGQVHDDQGNYDYETVAYST